MKKPQTPTPQRQYLEADLLPRFASTFAPDALVLNIGAGKHAYREYFQCPIRTSDISDAAGCDETFPVEVIPYGDNSVDGIVFNGVFERVAHPARAMQELYRVLRPGGTLLFGAPGIDFEWHSELDLWRLTPAGARHVVRRFRVREERFFGRAFYFFVLGKDGPSS